MRQEKLDQLLQCGSAKAQCLPFAKRGRCAAWLQFYCGGQCQQDFCPLICSIADSGALGWSLTRIATESLARIIS